MRTIGCEGPKQSILVLDSGSLVVQDQLDHHELWRGRWESNPTPFAANLLNFQWDFLFIGTTWDQKRGQLFNCFAVRSLDEMCIDA